MSEKHEVDIAVIKNDVARMKSDIDGLKLSQADHGKKLEQLQLSIGDLGGTIKAYATGIVVAVTIVEFVLKVYFR